MLFSRAIKDRSYSELLLENKERLNKMCVQVSLVLTKNTDIRHFI